MSKTTLCGRKAAFSGRHIRAVCCSAAVALATILGGCGGDDVSDAGPDRVKAVVTSFYGFEDPNKPAYSHANEAGDRIDVFGAEDDSGTFLPRQAVLASSSGHYRVFFDENGLPVRINNESDGSFIVVEPQDRTTRFLRYDAAGMYQGGFALQQDDDGNLSVAAVLGQPLFDGQINAQLSGTISGSLALVAEETSGLSALQPLPAALNAYLSDPAAQSKSIASALDRLTSLGASTYLVGGAIAGGLVTLAGGAAAGAAAVAAAQGALVGFGVALVAYTVSGSLTTIRDELPPGEGRDMFDSIFGSFSNSGSPKSLIDGALEQARSILESGRASLDRAVDFSSKIGDSATDVLSSLSDFASQPPPTDELPPIATDLTGFGVDQSGAQYTYTGTVELDGSVTASGTTPDGQATVTIEGDLTGNDFNGTYTGTNSSGTVTGSATDLGDCSTVQGSGGQGTFSFAHDVGANAGAVDFYYDAYSIPDAFDLYNGGNLIYTTGGLVSGSSSATLPVNARYVFVNVSAPQSGTAWEYSLSCAS